VEKRIVRREGIYAEKIDLDFKDKSYFNLWYYYKLLPLRWEENNLVCAVDQEILLCDLETKMAKAKIGFGKRGNIRALGFDREDIGFAAMQLFG